MMSCIFAGRKGRVAWQPPFQKKKMEKIAAKVASLAFVFCRPHSPSNGTSTKKKNGCKGDCREGDQHGKITLDRVFTFRNRVNKAKIASSAGRDWSRFPDIPEVNIDNLLSRL